MTAGTRKITIYGEALLRGFGSPDFVLYSDSIAKWEAVGHHRDDVTFAEKQQLIRFLNEEFATGQMSLEIK